MGNEANKVSELKSRIEVNEKEKASLQQTLDKIQAVRAAFVANECMGEDSIHDVNALMHFHNSTISLINQLRTKNIEIDELKEALKSER